MFSSSFHNYQRHGTPSAFLPFTALRLTNVNITNLVGENLGYSKYAYSIPAATANNVVYPSLDPSIFEVKYPNQDIQGRVVPL